MADQQEEDGKNDLLSFTVSFPSNLTSPYGGVDSIEKVVFMPELKYHVKHYLATIELYAAPLFTFTRTAEEIAGSPVCAVTRADLNFYATGRIIGRGVYKATTSALTLLKEPSPLMNLEYFSRFYTNQSHTALLRVYEEAAGGFSLMKDKYGFPDLGLVNSFTWNMQMRIQNAVIYYKPTDAEALKWVLIQYFVVGFLIQWAVWKIREVFVTRGIIATNAKDGVNEINA
ncbi:Transmembrane protein 231, putative [Angomonas deanei]|uniref:Transmembrane protein 231 n=1 Tax=Angomonas deanei TaxID=59799 RepID=A0A7G2C657_9TRYP|nr:Transmembrane protein 231, putative [Angomonas deanei]